MYLHGGGDPTLGDGGFNRDWEQGFGPTANQLVGQLRLDQPAVESFKFLCRGFLCGDVEENAPDCDCFAMLDQD